MIYVLLDEMSCALETIKAHAQVGAANGEIGSVAILEVLEDLEGEVESLVEVRK